MLPATVPNSFECVRTHIRMRIVNVPSMICVTVALIASLLENERPHEERSDNQDKDR
jgi:hypothetical protein